TYYDLLRPQWKDKLGIEAEDFDWFAQVVMDFGETQGLRLFRDIVASNGMSVRKGHSLLTNLVAAGGEALGRTRARCFCAAGQNKGRAARLVRDSAGNRPGHGRRARTKRAAPECGGAVLRFPHRGRGPAHPGQAPIRHREPEHRVAFQPGPAPAHRFGHDPRSSAKVAGPLPED